VRREIVADYVPQAIEEKWRERWEREGAFESDAQPGQPKYYVLEMLPYPSGTLHMGHMRNYTIGDAVARYKRMRGFNVLHPIGWDAFGLPAENAAIKRGIAPRDWTNANIAQMKSVCQRFGFSYDWRREISTCEPEYYKWNQWFFLRMLERGLAYRKRSRVNWCPLCQTVLANEQVVDGCCWQHDTTAVEAKEIEQWFLATTHYADALLDGLTDLAGGWPERVIAMQRNWIGKSRGARVRFGIMDAPGLTGAGLEIYTTRIDTIFGVSALILAPEHPLVEKLTAGVAGRASVEAQLDRLRKRSVRGADLATAEKEGFFLGRFALNPFSGSPVPIWVGNFVLMEYGTGAVMCVPAHDERDFEFATKYRLDKKIVVQPAAGKLLTPATLDQAFTSYGVLADSGPYSGLNSEKAIERMIAAAEDVGFGSGETVYRLKDWGISRQRYWGTPIPVVYCKDDGVVAVPDADLPVRLPENVALTGQGQSPLANVPDFVNTKCPKCGGPARRETDTMDTFVDSSWYFYRYTDPHNDKAPFDKSAVAYWFPIDQYIGGIEHAILHLIYSRFFCKVMHDLKLVDHTEPIKRLFSQGLVLMNGEKMSKSKGNLVGALDMAEKYGCDTARLYTLFAAPPERDLEWSEQGIEGCARFLSRLYRLIARHAEALGPAPAKLSSAKPDAQTSVSDKEKALRRKAHQTLRRVTKDFEERWHFNSSIALIMELVNLIQSLEPLEEDTRPEVIRETLELLTQMIAPMAPHLAEELWSMLGHAEGLTHAAWPEYVAQLAAEEQVEIVVQINGRTRGKILSEPGLGDDELFERVLADPRIAQLLAAQKIVKSIAVRDKLVNFVLS
jgi:leucyl-tRNA synthetase